MDLISQKIWRATFDVGTVRGTGPYSGATYTGSVHGTIGGPPIVTAISSSPYFAEAWAKLKPTKPTFQGLNAFYELREFPEMLRQEFLSKGLKGIADFHLALQFGWKPLLQDIRNLALTQIKVQKRLAWLIAHNGRPVRRKVILRDVLETETESSGRGYGVGPSGFVTQFWRYQPYYHVRQEWRQLVWASGLFRYWLPPGPRDIVWTRKMKAAIFGFKPTPAVVWNALPWSWLVDWFTNAGYVIQNMDAGVANRLAADYAYIMTEHLFKSKQDWIFGMTRKDGSPLDGAVSAWSESSRKMRGKGNPFGFSAAQLPLSAMQLSILGALGLSRA